MNYSHPPALLRSFLSPVMLAGVLFLAGILCPVNAASFSVLPIIGDIDADSKIAVFQITNQADESLSFQVQAFAWHQRDGKDVRSAAEDLLVVPPVATVEPKRTQLVRIALRDADRSREHAYRIVIRELPSQNGGGSGLSLQTLLAFDVPLFFAPEKATRELRWQVRKLDGGEVSIQADSVGSRYARFDSIRLVRDDGKVLASLNGPLYVLAAAHQVWRVPASSLSKGMRLKLVYSISGQEESVPIRVE